MLFLYFVNYILRCNRLGFEMFKTNVVIIRIWLVVVCFAFLNLKRYSVGKSLTSALNWVVAVKMYSSKCRLPAKWLL